MLGDVQGGPGLPVLVQNEGEGEGFVGGREALAPSIDGLFEPAQLRQHDGVAPVVSRRLGEA